MDTNNQQSSIVTLDEMHKRAGRRKLIILLSLFGICIAVLVALPFVVVSGYWLGIVMKAIIWGVFAMSIDLMIGYSGLLTLGQAAFFGVSAYTIAITLTRTDIGQPAAIALSLLLSTGVALVFGLIASHLKGLIFLMVTIAISQVVWGLAMQMTHLTGGDNGVSGVPRLSFGGAPLPTGYFFYFVAFIAVACAVLLFFLTKSPYGLALKGLKQSESRMRVLGYNVWLYKVLIITISGLFAGIAGMMFAFYSGFVGTRDVSIISGAQGLVMVLAGGAGSLIGPVIGAISITFAQNFVSSVTERWATVLGLIYILVVIFLPNGIIGLFKRGKKNNKDKKGNIIT